MLNAVFMSSLCRKVEQVAEEADSLKTSLDKYNLRHQRRMQEARERAELIGRAVWHCFLTGVIKFYYDTLMFPSNGLFIVLEW